tara:strand:+ start:172 stop:369 length:198 start_codon:yes stop_codon:yes gene_type:complete
LLDLIWDWARILGRAKDDYWIPVVGPGDMAAPLIMSLAMLNRSAPLSLPPEVLLCLLYLVLEVHS